MGTAISRARAGIRPHGPGGAHRAARKPRAATDAPSQPPPLETRAGEFLQKDAVFPELSAFHVPVGLAGFPLLSGAGRHVAATGWPLPGSSSVLSRSFAIQGLLGPQLLKGPPSASCHRAAAARLFTSGAATSGGRRVDIGARARELQIRRMWSLAMGGTLVAGFVIVVLNTFQENLMFYITPTQALEKFAAEPTKNRFRLGGLVLEGSVRRFAGSTDMEFVVTDLATEILVRYRGSVPDLFREGHSVVAEGFLKPRASLEDGNGGSAAAGEVGAARGGAAPPEPAAAPGSSSSSQGCYFMAVEVLAKHDEKYMPKEVAAAVARNKAAMEASGAAPPAIEAPVRARAPSKLSKVAQAPQSAQGYELSSQ